MSAFDRQAAINEIALSKGYINSAGEVLDPKGLANLKSRSADRLQKMVAGLGAPVGGPEKEPTKAPTAPKPSEAAPTAAPGQGAIVTEKAGDVTVTTTVKPGEPVKVDVVQSPKPATQEAKPYRLGDTDRVEMLTPAQALARNSGRSDNKRWAPAPDVKPSEAQAPKGIKVGKDREEARDLGRKKDREEDVARQEFLNKKAEEVQAHEAKAKEGKAKPAGKAKKIPTGRVRQAWEGLGMCAFIRVMSANGHKREDVLPTCKTIGFTPLPDSATVGIQYNRGQRGDGVPKVSDEVLKKIKKAVKESKSA